MLEILSDSFRRFTHSDPPEDLIGRRDRLYFYVIEAANNTEVLGLSENAMKSLAFCAFSNYSRARHAFDTPATATRNSTDILEIARLGHGSEVNIRIGDVTTDLELGVEVLFPEMLVPETEPEPHLVLHDYYTKKLDIMRLEGHGCPAYGQVLNTMYRRYVDAVFNPLLAQEGVSQSPDPIQV